MNVYKNKGKVALTIDLKKIGEKCNKIASVLMILMIIGATNLISIALGFYCTEEVLAVAGKLLGIVIVASGIIGALLTILADKLQ